MRSRPVSIIVTLLVFIGLVLGVRWWWLQSTLLVPISFSSKIDQQIEVIDQFALQSLLEKYDIFVDKSLTYTSPDTQVVSTVSHIKVVLVDKPQPSNKVLGAESVELSSLGVEVQGDTLEASVYFNMDAMSDFSAEDVDRILTQTLLGYLYYFEHTPVTPSNPIFQQFERDLNSLPPVFTLRNNSNFFQRLLNFNPVPQAYAQSCSGTIQYGTLQTQKRCNGGANNGGTCSGPLDCPGGSCDSETVCSNLTTCDCDNAVIVCGTGGSCGSGSNCTENVSCSTGGGGGSNPCPSGQIFCGDCINGCRANTQTCNSWIAAECSGGGGGGGGSNCTWCTGSAECGASGGSWQGAGSSWCSSPLGACCVDPSPPCSPSCGSPACGGGDGCGGTCSNADNGAPPTPTISAPTNGGIALMNPSTLRITVDWNNTNKADSYQIQAFPGGTSCSDPSARCTTVTNSVYSWVPDQVSYQVRVRAVNTTCDADYSGWTAYTYFDVHAPVTGTVYLDPNNTAALTGGVCTTGASLATIQAGASEVTISQNGTDYTPGTVAANGTYQASAPYWDPGNNILQLNIGDSSLYTCTCPAGCVYSGISTPTIGLNYYLIEARDPWFQIEGGPVTALQDTGTAIRNYISDKCSEDPDCQPYLIAQNNDTEFSSGYIMTGGGSVDLQYTPGDQTSNVDQDGRNIVAQVDRKVSQERYQYFIRLYKFPETPTSDFTTSASDAQKPVLPPTNTGVNAYFHNGDLTIQDQWDVGVGEEIMIFVDGNVTIANQLQTEVGGFLGIIASGDITIDPSVEHTTLTETTGLVEGLFVANGQILLPSRGVGGGGDGRFVGEGTFVGWNGVVAERDYDDNLGRKVENNHKPTETFRYRPDFLLNAPDEIRVPRYIWREVAP